MSLILNNSRDIGNKFLFGHWMMKPKGGGQLLFAGPGFGRVNYWMHNLEHVEEDMIEMKKQNLKGYIIEFCGKMSPNDGCWDCCKNDHGATWNEETNEVHWEDFHTNYFTDEWYDEAKTKYKELIKLCRKHNMWLLNLVFNDNRWQKQGIEGYKSLAHWIEQYPEASDQPGSTDHPDRPELSRKEELRMAISESIGHVMKEGIPSKEQLERVFNEVIFPCNGQSHVVISPVNEPETDDGKDIEERYIKKAKNKGFATCSYNEIKYGARMFQGGHRSSISEAKCPKGIGVNDNGKLLCELYFENPEDKEWEDIEESQQAIPNKVEQLIRNYKNSKAKGALFYAIHYNGNNVDKEAISAIKRGWYS